MSKKYIVLPEDIRSKSDGDSHYIGHHQLMSLYGVNPNECILVHPSKKRLLSQKYCEDNDINYNDENRNPSYLSIDSEDIRKKVLGMTMHSISTLIVLRPCYDGSYKLDPPLFLSSILNF